MGIFIVLFRFSEQWGKKCIKAADGTTNSVDSDQTAP